MLKCRRPEAGMEAKVKADIEEHIRLFRTLEEGMLPDVISAALLMRQTLDDGKKILVAGNGGSAADAQHFAAELMGRYLKERPPRSAISLTTDTSILTAVGNDYGFEEIFSRQVDGLGREGDVLLGISTSGTSQNLVRAFETANRKGMSTVALLGKTGGAMKELADVVVLVPSNHTPRIQEAQQWVWHTWCDLIDCMDKH